MRKSWIIALAWVLIVTVPVQGYAAAIMVNCGPRHQDSTRQSTRVADLQGHHAHASNVSGLAHEHFLNVDVSHAASQQVPVEHSTNVSCSACAACCIGIGLPSAVMLPAVVSVSLPPLFEAAVPAVDIVVNGPERPPRIVLV
jgi:hypothetical protein